MADNTALIPTDKQDAIRREAKRRQGGSTGRFQPSGYSNQVAAQERIERINREELAEWAIKGFDGRAQHVTEWDTEMVETICAYIRVAAGYPGWDLHEEETCLDDIVAGVDPKAVACAQFHLARAFLRAKYKPNDMPCQSEDWFESMLEEARMSLDPQLRSRKRVAEKAFLRFKTAAPHKGWVDAIPLVQRLIAIWLGVEPVTDETEALRQADGLTHNQRSSMFFYMAAALRSTQVTPAVQGTPAQEAAWFAKKSADARENERNRLYRQANVSSSDEQPDTEPPADAEEVTRELVTV